MTDDLIRLSSGPFSLVLNPSLGGSIARFDCDGEPVMRPAPGKPATVLEMASFPLVPFSGRIDAGQFPDGDRTISLPPNFPGRPDDLNTIHGYGWLSSWIVAMATETSATLMLDHEPGDWPWSFRAGQRFDMTPDGFIQRLALTNTGTSPMPAGLGAHPFFPRNTRTVYGGLHSGEWGITPLGIPTTEDRRAAPRDWWQGAPVESRLVDTAYASRSGDLAIHWADRGLSLTMEPTPGLAHTLVYVPPGESFFCVEPISHIPNAHNAPDPTAQGLRWLEPGERWDESITYRVART
jgi:aldose 1-epimerase